MFSFFKKQKCLELNLDDYSSLPSDIIFNFFVEFADEKSLVPSFYKSTDQKLSIIVRATSLAFELLFLCFPYKFKAYQETFSQSVLLHFNEKHFSSDSTQSFINEVSRLLPSWEKIFKFERATLIRNNTAFSVSAEKILDISSITLCNEKFSMYKTAYDPLYSETVNYIAHLLTGLIESFNELFYRTESITTSQSKITFKIKV